MAHGPPIPLTAVSVNLDSAEFRAICDWPFADAYITRLLQDDIPQRVIFGNCSVWTYRDGRGSLVGFGTLDVSADCNTYTRGLSHPYIPLLAINPTIKSKGYGTSIVRHLIDEAALITSSVACYDVLLLDVYIDNQKAIKLYAGLGFQQISPAPTPDPAEDGRAFIVMGRSVGIERD